MQVRDMYHPEVLSSFGSGTLKAHFSPSLCPKPELGPNAQELEAWICSTCLFTCFAIVKIQAQGTHESYEVRMPEAAENSNLQVSSDSKSHK